LRREDLRLFAGSAIAYDRTPAALRVPAARRLDPGIYREKSGGIEIIDMRHGVSASGRSRM